MPGFDKASPYVKISSTPDYHESCSIRLEDYLLSIKQLRGNAGVSNGL